MNMPRNLYFGLLFTIMASLGGCTQRQPPTEETSVVNEAIPEVNEENCKPENVSKIINMDTRKKFQDLCVRRSTYKPSPARNW